MTRVSRNQAAGGPAPGSTDDVSTERAGRGAPAAEEQQPAAAATGPRTTVGAAAAARSESARETAAAMGSVFGGGAAAARAPSASVDLAAMEGRFLALAEKSKARPKGDPEVVREGRQLYSELTPAIDRTERDLAETKATLAQEEAKLGWFRRNLPLIAPKDVDELRDKVEAQEEFLEKARAFRGGASVAARSGKQADASMDAGAWRGRIDRAASDIPRGDRTGDRWPAGVANLGREQEKLKEATDAASLENQAVDKDVKDLSKEVRWHETWKWLDCLTFGESPRGGLYRQAKAMGQDAGSVAKGMSDVQAHGEGRVRSEVTGLLKAERPEFAQKHARYELLKDAHDSLSGTVQTARDARSSLDSAETWIRRRDSLRHSEPTEYEWRERTRADGTTEREQVETYDHRQWEDDLRSATSYADQYRRSAEREVSELNGRLPGLKQSLGRLNEDTGFRGRFDADLADPWGGFLNRGYWSYDSSEVDRMQRQVSELRGRLEGIQSRVAPEYRSHDAYVSGAISARRTELLRGNR